MKTRPISPLLRDIIRRELEIKDRLREDLGRGIPDFAVLEIAKETTESCRRRLVTHINQMASDSKRRRELTAEARETLDEIEEAVAEILREKLSLYIKTT